MGIDKNTSYGKINISLEAIALVAGQTATTCYGVVGLSSKRSLKDEINAFLKKENYKDGVTVKKTGKDAFEVNMYIIVGSNLKITEVVSEVQKRVKYELEKTFGIKFRSVNVYVLGVDRL